MKCRHCAKKLEATFVDLGFAPPSNAYLTEDAVSRPETYYPLKVKVCEDCWLVQTCDYTRADELFDADYAYFSSTSSSWLEHAAAYTEKIIGELNLTKNSHVIEVASNDGYLLKNFVEKGIPCLGIEPTESTSKASEQLGIPVLRAFFGKDLGERLASEGRQADLVIGNNVYAHVPDINDFTHGLKAVLKSGGTVTLEFPHLIKLIENTQFDTIYHEHFSYLTLNTASIIFELAGLRIYKVEKLGTHGGSLRVFGCHIDDARKTHSSVYNLLAEEQRLGLQDLNHYSDFQSRVDEVKDDLLNFLIDQKRAGKKVAAYGAAAKGNTLLNYAGIKPDLLPFVCDAAPAKQGKYMPGNHLPILPPKMMEQFDPDYVLILPWNIADEVSEQLSTMLTKKTQYVTAIPKLTIFQN